MRGVVACALACLAIAGEVQAHPHVELETRIIVWTDAAGAQSLKVEWLFDDAYSNLIIRDNRKAKSGDFTASEIAAIRRRQFDNVKEFNYFLQPVFDGGKPLKISDVRDFSARIDGDRVRYSFIAPLPPQKNRAASLTVTLADPENFVKLIMPRYGSVSVEGPGKSKVACKRIRAPDISTPNGVIEPDAVRCAPPGQL